MKGIFNKYGIILDEEKLNKFELYYELLIKYNEMFNITAITEKEEVYKKHFTDSLLGREFIKGNSVIDIGAGGGFPSIPLKILNEDKSFILVDATEKKCEFLREVILKLDLKNTEVICGRAEELGKNIKYREKFDVCVSRAVARLNILCEYCIPFIKVGGSFVAYKGDAESEISEAENAIKALGCKIEKIENLSLKNKKRTIVEIKKIKNTESKYPRANGRIRKNPL